MINLNDWILEFAVTLFTFASAVIGWFVRTVLTDKRKVELLESALEAIRKDIVSRDVRREEDRDIMREVKDDIKIIKADILEIYKHNLK
jgi:hypothetical protein